MDTKLESKYLKDLAKGDHNAFDMLYVYYSPKVRLYLTGFIKDNDEAKDLTQEIFYRIWINRESISKIESLNAYLFRMAHNIICDYYKHNLIEEKYQQEMNISYTDNSIEENIYAKELSLLIDMAIDKMPHQQKNIFIMSRKNGLSNEEIAHELNISKRTVENHLTHALAELRKIVYSILILF